MATQAGPLPFTGSIGGVTGYKRNGKYHLKEKSVITRDRVLSSAGFARTRENAKEWRRAVRAGMLVRHSLRRLLKDLRLADNHLSGRLHGCMKSIVKSDPVSDRGERTVSKGQLELLEDFAFQKDKSFSSVFAAGPVSSIDTDTGKVKVELRPFDPWQRIQAPEGATHFKIVVSAASIDFDKERWNQVSTGTGYLSLEEYMEQPICLEQVLVPKEGECLLLAMGVVFYVQQEDGQFERVKGGVMRILQVSEPGSRQVGTGLGGIERIGRKEEAGIVDARCKVPDCSVEAVADEAVAALKAAAVSGCFAEADDETGLPARAIRGNSVEQHDNETLAELLQCLPVNETFAPFPT